MIRGVHTMFYSSDAQATRAFIRDVLGFRSADVGDGWLIFELPEGYMGCHPAYDDEGARPGAHAISFYCDDLRKTVAELKDRGVNFVRTITDEGFGLVTYFEMPGDIRVQLYQPHYQKQFD